MASTAKFGRKFISLALPQYDVRFSSPFHFPPQELPNILGEVVSAAGKSQLRMAETEKYAHVTYFFNGGVEKPFPGRRPQTDSLAKGRYLRPETGDERLRSDR